MATYYVRPTNGDDTDTGLSFALAFKTYQKAVDTAATAGDVIRLCAFGAEGSESPVDPINFDTNAVVAIGVQTIGADDSDGSPLTGSNVATIDISGMTASEDGLTFTLNDQHHHFDRIRITGGGRDSILISNAIDLFMQRCRIDAAGSDGILCTSTEDFSCLTDCEIDGCSGWGGQVNAAGRWNVNMKGGRVHDNGAGGVETGGDFNSVAFLGVEVYDNGGIGLQLLSGGDVDHCVVFGNSGDGLRQEGMENSITNSTFVDNTAYGVNATHATPFLLFSNNHTDGNTTAAYNPATIHTDHGEEDAVTGDPLFTSETDGAEDFIPTASSPLKGAGLHGTDIGARRAADAAGGGGLLVHPGMAGGMRG